MTLLEISDALARDLRDITFRSPITHVYNPLVYARTPHAAYLERWGNGPKEIVLVGMNPGPFGMAQTGVPRMVACRGPSLAMMRIGNLGAF